MKNRFLILYLIISPFMLTAQEKPIHTGIGIGYQLVQYQNDFGFGLNVVSPYFANQKVGVRLKGNLMFNETVIDKTTTWLPYSNISLGMVSVGGYIGNRIRIYGEGGVIGILPPVKISSETVAMGGYGHFGFEFFFAHPGNYFIEIGGMGSSAKADKLETKPIFSNGLTISTGVRFFFK